ncbi:hypothetical protein EI94DRAFT_1816081 [Lactarius quietus]|nr:hypothetical protein EI94DRAFT_1816081 [Lactarius quietus]
MSFSINLSDHFTTLRTLSSASYKREYITPIELFSRHIGISVVSDYTNHLSIGDFNSIALNLEDIEWVQLLSRFSSVQTLFVSTQISGHVSRALEDIVGVIFPAEVLPALDMLCLEGQPESSIDKFISVCRDSGRSVTFIYTKAEFNGRLKYYEYETREAS